MGGSDAVVVVATRGEGRVIALGPAQNVVKVGHQDSGGRVGVLEMTLQQFGPPPQHHHGAVDHVWCVLEGRLEATIGTREVRLETGTVAFVPSGVKHTFWNPDAAPCRMLEIDTPRALDQYYDEIATAFPPGATLDPSVAGEIMRRHDTVL